MATIIEIDVTVSSSLGDRHRAVLVAAVSVSPSPTSSKRRVDVHILPPQSTLSTTFLRSALKSSASRALIVTLH